MDLSIIVPAYKPGRHLQGFLERLKIIDEMLRDNRIQAELIFVHNGSSDSLIWQFPEFKSISLNYQHSTARLTPSQARNVGLELSQGLYILFHDMDDMLHIDFPSTFSQLLWTTHESRQRYDLTIFNYRKIRRGAPEVIDHGMGRESCHLDNQAVENYVDAYILEPHKYTLFVHCWSKLYLRSFLMQNHLRFKADLEQLEDVNFNFRLLACHPSVYYSTNLCYDYTVSAEGASLSTQSGAKGRQDIKNTIKALLAVKALLQNHFLSKLEVRSRMGHLYATIFVLWILRVGKRIKDIRVLHAIIKSYIQSHAVQNAMIYYKRMPGTSWIIPRLVMWKLSTPLTMILVIKNRKEFP